MAARSVLACISLIAFAIASQPAAAANDDSPPPANPSTTNPSASPAKRPHRQHAGKHRRHQKPSPQTDAPASN
jgi:hypothetical protein